VSTHPRVSPAYVQRLLNSMDDPGSSLMYLSQFWSVRARLNERGELVGLSDAERVVHLVSLYTGEVGNGGHVQYLLNPAGAFAHETIDALGALSATKAMETLAGVVAIFPDGRVPKDREKRTMAVHALSDQLLQKLDEADRTIWGISLDAPALAYLRDRPADVLAAEKS
jgi:hypothetical protein